MPTFEALEEEWADHPPVHHLVAAYLDYKRPADREESLDRDLSSLMSSMPVNTSAPKLDDSAWQKFTVESGNG